MRVGSRVWRIWPLCLLLVSFSGCLPLSLAGEEGTSTITPAEEAEHSISLLQGHAKAAALPTSTAKFAEVLRMQLLDLLAEYDARHGRYLVSNDFLVNVIDPNETDTGAQSGSINSSNSGNSSNSSNSGNSSSLLSLSSLMGNGTGNETAGNESDTVDIKALMHLEMFLPHGSGASLDDLLNLENLQAANSSGSPFSFVDALRSGRTMSQNESNGTEPETLSAALQDFSIASAFGEVAAGLLEVGGSDFSVSEITVLDEGKMLEVVDDTAEANATANTTENATANASSQNATTTGDSSGGNVQAKLAAAVNGAASVTEPAAPVTDSAGAASGNANNSSNATANASNATASAMNETNATGTNVSSATTGTNVSSSNATNVLNTSNATTSAMNETNTTGTNVSNATAATNVSSSNATNASLLSSLLESQKSTSRSTRLAALVTAELATLSEQEVAAYKTLEAERSARAASRNHAAGPAAWSSYGISSTALDEPLRGDRPIVEFGYTIRNVSTSRAPDLQTVLFRSYSYGLQLREKLNEKIGAPVFTSAVSKPARSGVKLNALPFVSNYGRDFLWREVSHGTTTSLLGEIKGDTLPDGTPKRDVIAVMQSLAPALRADGTREYAAPWMDGLWKKIQTEYDVLSVQDFVTGSFIFVRPFDMVSQLAEMVAYYHAKEDNKTLDLLSEILGTQNFSDFLVLQEGAGNSSSNGGASNSTAMMNYSSNSTVPVDPAAAAYTNVLHLLGNSSVFTATVNVTLTPNATSGNATANATGWNSSNTTTQETVWLMSNLSDAGMYKYVGLPLLAAAECDVSSRRDEGQKSFYNAQGDNATTVSSIQNATLSKNDPDLGDILQTGVMELDERVLKIQSTLTKMQAAHEANTTTSTTTKATSTSTTTAMATNASSNYSANLTANLSSSNSSAASSSALFEMASDGTAVKVPLVLSAPPTTRQTASPLTAVDKNQLPKGPSPNLPVLPTAMVSRSLVSSNMQRATASTTGTNNYSLAIDFNTTVHVYDGYIPLGCWQNCTTSEVLPNNSYMSSACVRCKHYLISQQWCILHHNDPACMHLLTDSVGYLLKSDLHWRNMSSFYANGSTILGTLFDEQRARKKASFDETPLPDGVLDSQGPCAYDKLIGKCVLKSKDLVRHALPHLLAEQDCREACDTGGDECIAWEYLQEGALNADSDLSACSVILNPYFAEASIAMKDSDNSLHAKCFAKKGLMSIDFTTNSFLEGTRGGRNGGMNVGNNGGIIAGGATAGTGGNDVAAVGDHGGVLRNSLSEMSSSARRLGAAGRVGMQQAPWQPSDYDPLSLEARSKSIIVSGLNLTSPLTVDARPLEQFATYHDPIFRRALTITDVAQRASYNEDLLAVRLAGTETRSGVEEKEKLAEERGVGTWRMSCAQPGNPVPLRYFVQARPTFMPKRFCMDSADPRQQSFCQTQSPQDAYLEKASKALQSGYGFQMREPHGFFVAEEKLLQMKEARSSKRQGVLLQQRQVGGEDGDADESSVERYAFLEQEGTHQAQIKTASTSRKTQSASVSTSSKAAKIRKSGPSALSIRSPAASSSTSITPQNPLNITLTDFFPAFSDMGMGELPAKVSVLSVIEQTYWRQELLRQYVGLRGNRSLEDEPHNTVAYHNVLRVDDCWLLCAEWADCVTWKYSNCVDPANCRLTSGTCILYNDPDVVYLPDAFQDQEHQPAHYWADRNYLHGHRWCRIGYVPPGWGSSMWEVLPFAFVTLAACGIGVCLSHCKRKYYHKTSQLHTEQHLHHPRRAYRADSKADVSQPARWLPHADRLHNHE